MSEPEEKSVSSIVVSTDNYRSTYGPPSPILAKEPQDIQLPPLTREESIEQDRHRVHKILMEPFRYVLERPGKDVRNLLLEAFQAWVHCPLEVLIAIKEIISMLHNGSLLIDDIEDKSLMRRGRPVAHKIYGEASVINCGNYVYFQAMDACRKLKSPQV